MRVKVRKQGRDDFTRRIQRLDPKFAATPAEARDDRKPWEVEKSMLSKSERPLLMLLLGLVIACGAFFSIQNPDVIRDFLLNTGWPPQFLTYAMNGISILILGLGALLLGNVFRVLNPRATGRWNAGGLVAGAAAGIAMYNIPEGYVETGLNYAGFNNAGEIFDYAQERSYEIANIDWASLVMVSSAAK